MFFSALSRQDHSNPLLLGVKVRKLNEVLGLVRDTDVGVSHLGYATVTDDSLLNR